MLICDSSRLVTSLVKFKDFRFSDSLEWRAFYTFQKIQYFLENLLVINCPIAKIIKDITIKSKLSHLLTCKSLTKDSNSSSENEIVFLFVSRFLIALFTRSSYPLLPSFFVNPKSVTEEIEISIASSFLKKVFILSIKSGVSSLVLSEK